MKLTQIFNECKYFKAKIKKEVNETHRMYGIESFLRYDELVDYREANKRIEKAIELTIQQFNNNIQNETTN